MMCLGLTGEWHFPVLWVVVVGEEETRGINVGLAILVEEVGTEKRPLCSFNVRARKTSFQLYIQVTSWQVF